jgi:hypothetical protein
MIIQNLYPINVYLSFATVGVFLFAMGLVWSVSLVLLTDLLPEVAVGFGYGAIFMSNIIIV